MDGLKLSVRRTAELLARNVVLRTRLPSRYGRRPLFVSPANNLSILKPGDGKFDNYLFAIVDRFVRPDSVVWDIGANMGVFSVAAAHLARSGFVLSIEPDPFNQLLLQKTRGLMMNADLKFDILPAAVSKELGIAQLRIASRGRAANSLVGAAGSTQMGGVRAHFTVITVTLDWLLGWFPSPNLVKCDAEGAEIFILEGGRRLLSELRPVVIFEMAKESAAMCRQILNAHDYAAFSAKSLVGAQGGLDVLDGISEVLAVPREQAAIGNCLV
jgi:FkbM family methyltransferase